MASVAANNVASNASTLNIMPPEFFNSLMGGSSSFKDSKAFTPSSSDNEKLVANDKDTKNDAAVTPITAAALSSAVRNMLNSEFLRQKWLYSQKYDFIAKFDIIFL